MGGVGIGVEEEKVATGFPRGFMGVLEGGKVRESVMRILKFWDKSNETGASKFKTSSDRSKISPIRSSARHQTGRSTGYTQVRIRVLYIKPTC